MSMAHSHINLCPFHAVPGRHAITAQSWTTHAGDEACMQERTVKGHPAMTLGMTFLVALVLGAFIGAIVIVFVFHNRNKALRKHTYQAEKPDYYSSALQRPVVE
jgi:hypothetical protein